MKLFIIIKQSLKAIMSNKGRSFLTTLGIVIGIGSVIALMALGAGVQDEIASRVSTLGATNLIIMPGAGFAAASGGMASGEQAAHPGAQSPSSMAQGGTSSSLTIEDLDTLRNKEQNPDIKFAAGNVTGSAIFTTDKGDTRFSVTGTEPELFQIQKYKMAKGTALTQANIDNKEKVIVLGSQTKTDLFGSKDAIGKELVIAETPYKVIGVLSNVEESGFSNPNKQIYVPYTSAMDNFKAEKFNTITAQAKDEGSVSAAKASIKKTLLKNHGIKEEKLADFNVNTSADLLTTVSSITGIMTSLLAGIAAISLLVGGIGIMNIMLVSVTERTREIGLRKAVGAKTGDILLQFVIEAVLLTLTGGLLGIGFGYGLATAAASMLGFAPAITPDAVALAVGVSSIVGLVFGIYPAAKAARLDPIDALRYE